MVMYHEPIGGFFGQVGSSGVRGLVSMRGERETNERESRGDGRASAGRLSVVCDACQSGAGGGRGD